MTRTARAAVAALVLAAACAGCGAGPIGGRSNGVAPKPAATPTVAPTLAAPEQVGTLVPPAGSIYFGGFANPSGLGNGNNPSALAGLEAQLGRTFALHLSQFAFLTAWPTLPVLDDVANDRLSVAFWDCGVSDAQVAGGTADSALQTRAQAVAAFGRPIMVSFFYDVNVPSGSVPRPRPLCYDATTDEASGAFAPSGFIAAWQHIRAIFAAARATNVIWVWTVAASAESGTAALDPRPYYPGDAQVDWIGIDAYDFADLSFTQTFQVLYSQLAAFKKPILITDTGATAENQTVFFQQAVPALRSQFPQVGGLMYDDTLGSEVDWRVTTAAFPAFAAMADDPYLSARVPAADYSK